MFQTKIDSRTDFEKKLRKTNRIMKDIYNQLDDIKNMYDLSDDDLKELNQLKSVKLWQQVPSAAPSL